MLENVRFQKRVPAELERAISLYEKSSIETANRVRKSISETLELIEQFPEMYAVVYDDIRIVKTKRYPFLIEYRILNAIPIILSVSHSNRENIPQMGG